MMLIGCVQRFDGSLPKSIVKSDSGDLTVIVGQIFEPDKPIDYESVRASWHRESNSECTDGYIVVSNEESLWDVLPYDGSVKLKITGVIRCKPPTPGEMKGNRLVPPIPRPRNIPAQVEIIACARGTARIVQ